MSDYEHHPAADAFPMMDSSAFADLVADIRDQGLRQSIVLCDGQILDGRNRYRACAEAGIEPQFETYEGDDPIGYVVSLNLKRRHLSESQRAMVAAKLANMKPGHRSDLKPSADMHEVLSIPHAAEMLNVSVRSVKNARAVRQHGTPEEVAAVESGEAAVTTTANTIRNRKKQEQADPMTDQAAEAAPTRKPGPTLPVPEGETPESLVRHGMAMEADGTSPEQAAQQIGWSIQKYRQSRDIVQIADRGDLSSNDADAAQRALRRLNETAQAGPAHQEVKPLVKKLWGNGRGATRSQIEQRRLEHFENALTIITQTCRQAAELELPHLDADRGKRALADAKEAEKNARTFRQRIERTYQ